jgi:ABC-2 type transport system ATP-binding protein
LLGRRLVLGDEAFRGDIGILTEHPGLYERLSLWHNLEYAARLQGMPRSLFSRRAEELLQRFTLWPRRAERVSTFSKGMKQKAAIVRALLHEPKLLFLDEPTSGLDPEAAREVCDTILDLKRQGRTVLLTTHRLTEAETLADRVAILQTRLLAEGSVSELRGRLYGRRVAVTVGDRHDELAGLSAALPFVKHVERAESRLLISLADPERQTPELVRALVHAGAAIVEVCELKQSLESVYLDLVGKEAAP